MNQRIKDYIMMTKPRLISLVLLTTLAGFFLGSNGSPDLKLLLTTLIGSSLVACGALVLNQYIERDVDALMKRTSNRPLPSKRLNPVNALIFGIVLSLIGLIINFFFINTLTAILALLSLTSYLFVYTPMKKISALCILVGAVPGALPIAGGWVAATGNFDFSATILFSILFFWQIPHSLAIAWLYKGDYERAGLKLLPDFSEDSNAVGHQVLLNSMALLPIGLMPSVFGMTGHIHFFTALILGIGFTLFAAKFARNRSITSAKKLLYASYLYIPFQLGVMSFDQITN